MKKIIKIFFLIFIMFLSINLVKAESVDDDKYSIDNQGEEIIQRRIFIGDKRAIDIQLSVDSSKYDNWITNPTGNLEWLETGAIPLVEDKYLQKDSSINTRTAVIIILGINDFRSEKSIEYYNYLNELSDSWAEYSKFSIHFVSLTRVKKKNIKNYSNSVIKEFNDNVRDNLYDDISFINAYGKNKKRKFDPWSDVKYSDDGLYYDSETNKEIYDYILKELYNTNDLEKNSNSLGLSTTTKSLAKKNKPKINSRYLKLGIGDKYTLKIRDIGDSNATISWSSSNSNCVEVNENGLVNIKKVGKATISGTIKYSDGSEKTLKSSVVGIEKQVISNLKITGNKTVSLNKKVRLKLTVTPTQANENIVWKIESKEKKKSGKDVKQKVKFVRKCKNKRKCTFKGNEIGEDVVIAEAESGVVSRFNITVTDAKVVKPKKSDKNMIHFVNVGSGDAIVIESKGKYGLIDSGTYHNGKAIIVDYLEKNGITHLDFIIVTHGDGDHRGGIKQILRTYTYDNEDKKKKDKKTYLVDNKTLFIYKKTQDFEYNKEIDYSDNTSTYKELMRLSTKDRSPYIVESIITLKKNLQLNTKYYKVKFEKKEKEDDSYISFKMNDMSFKIYNLDNLIFNNASSFTNLENSRSLVTFINIKSQDKKWRVLSMGDVNNIAGIEKYYGNLIGNVDLLKLGHHGYVGSNTKSLLDATKPTYAIVSNNKDLFHKDYDFQIPYIYLTDVLGTKLYQTGDYSDSVKAIFTDKISIEGKENKKKVTNLDNLKDGAYRWREWLSDSKEINTNITSTNHEITYMYYVRNNGKEKEIVKDEYIYDDNNGVYYYYDKNGRRLYTDSDYTGSYDYTIPDNKTKKTKCAFVFKKDKKGKYFLKCNKTKIKSKFIKINGKKYYFDNDGYMATEWKKINGDWYYFDKKGVIKTGWLKYKNTYYYLDPTTGIMATGNKKINEKNYKFDKNGKCKNYK